MEQEKKYRHELKYRIPMSEYLAMRSRLKAVMDADPHAGEDGRYLIRSIYFDNSDDKALLEKINGVPRREKFRIRYYNDDLSFITLEKKMKINDKCLKYDARITEEELRKILAGDIEFMKDHPDGLVKEMFSKMRYQRLRPRVLVSYVREPYIYKAGNVRVTFDFKIRTSLWSRDFLESLPPGISATETPDEMYLEVKYDAFLPDVIHHLIQTPGLRKQAFSKYVAARRFG